MRTRELTRLGILVALVIVSFAPAAGEEELLKDGGKYLGWQGLEERKIFVTCQKEPIDIGRGKVQQTSLKCPGQKGGVYSFFEGTVKAVNVENKTIHIHKGRSREFVVPAMNEGEGRLLRAGDKVSGSEGPVPGRVESIKKKWN